MAFTNKQRRNLFSPKTIMDLVNLMQAMVIGDYKTCLFLEGGTWVVQRIESKTRLYVGKNEQDAVKAFWLSVTEDE